MWLNKEKTCFTAIKRYQESLLNSCPNHVVIDGLFNETKLNTVWRVLLRPENWQRQQHTYSALYVDHNQWENTPHEQRFVQRDRWVHKSVTPKNKLIDAQVSNNAQEFLIFLRSEEFMSLLSRIFNVHLTDKNVSKSHINTNFFRLGRDDFVEQHADDSPGRQVCLLLYLNKQWDANTGGELCFKGDSTENSEDEESLTISPLYNRCVLFNPASNGSEHWVKRSNTETMIQSNDDQYRYNVTSWYWSE